MSILGILCMIVVGLIALYTLYQIFLGTGSLIVKVMWGVLLAGLGAAAYFIYIYLIATNSTVVTSVYLKSSTPTIIDAKTLTSPNAANSAFGIWIYVNSWNTTNKKVVFKTSGNEVSLYFDPTTPSLKCDVQSGCVANQKQTETITITNNFPLQKWTYVVVSLNGAFIDAFLDGKLIASHKMLNSSLSIACGNTPWNINMGTEFDAYAYNLIRYTHAMTPTEAYQTYYSTAPSSNSLGIFNGMNINLAIVTNDNTCDSTVIL